MSEWKPIETAPKDGSPVLAFFGPRHIEGVFWDDAPGVWCFYSDGDITFPYKQPTHWMPLPEPPKP